MSRGSTIPNFVVDLPLRILIFRVLLSEEACVRDYSIPRLCWGPTSAENYLHWTKCSVKIDAMLDIAAKATLFVILPRIDRARQAQHPLEQLNGDSCLSRHYSSATC